VNFLFFPDTDTPIFRTEPYGVRSPEDRGHLKNTGA
jgi:hypothetical protein